MPAEGRCLEQPSKSNRLPRKKRFMQIEVKNLRKSYRVNGADLNVLDDISFTVNSKEFLTIIGPSGCGKSTILNILAGFVPKDGGEIKFNGKKVENLQKIAAYMVQKDLLMPWRTVIGNTILGPEIEGQDMKKAKDEAISLLDSFGLGGFYNSYPSELSGGMRQRVALARTLMFKRPLLLLDEPFGALDAMTRFVMQNLFLKVWKKYEKTVVLVTHDIDEALLLSDRIIVLSSRPARIKSTYTIEQPRPRDLSALATIKKKIFDELKEEIGSVFGNGSI